MPQATDLTGIGVQPILAEALGNQASTLACAASSTQTGAAKVLSKNVELTVADSSHNSAILPTGALVGSPHYFFNSSSTSAIVYVPVGDYLNLSQNAGLTIAQNKAAYVFKYKQVGATGYWASNLTA